MATYEVKSGKHHIPVIHNKRVALTTYKPGDRFTAEKWQVKNIQDKLVKVNVNKEEEREKVANEQIKIKFKRKEHDSAYFGST